MTLAHAVKAELEHIPLIAADVIEAERIEVLAAHGLSVEQAIEESMRNSFFSRTLFVGAVPLAMFGVSAMLGVSGAVMPWAISTNAVDRYPVAFWRASLHFFRQMGPRYTFIQFVDARNTRSLRWLARLGFTVDEEPQPFGKDRMPFFRVVRKARLSDGR